MSVSIYLIYVIYGTFHHLYVCGGELTKGWRVHVSISQAGSSV